MMTLPKQLVDLLFRLREIFCVFCLYDDDSHHSRELGSEKLLLRGSYGDENCIVLILALCVLTLGSQNPDYHERYVLDSDGLSNRILVSKQIVHDRLAKQTYFCGGLHILRGEWAAG